VLVQKGKIACASFRQRWDDVIRDDLMLVQEGKPTHATFPP